MVEGVDSRGGEGWKGAGCRGAVGDGYCCWLELNGQLAEAGITGAAVVVVVIIEGVVGEV